MHSVELYEQISLYLFISLYHLIRLLNIQNPLHFWFFVIPLGLVTAALKMPPSTPLIDWNCFLRHCKVSNQSEHQQTEQQQSASSAEDWIWVTVLRWTTALKCCRQIWERLSNPTEPHWHSSLQGHFTKHCSTLYETLINAHLWCRLYLLNGEFLNSTTKLDWLR